VRAFRLVDQERAHHAVSVLCSVLKVTRQGYYAWKRRAPSARRLRDDELKADILGLYERSRDTYGAPRIKDRLRIEQGIRIGQKRAARLMRELGIVGTGKGQRRIRTTIPDRRAPAAPDRVGRDFTATSPDEKWVADITYIPTTRAGSSWPLSPTVTAAGSSAGRCETHSKPSWSPTRSR
jgi:putative transposase